MLLQNGPLHVVDGGGLGRLPLGKPGLFEVAAEFHSAAKADAAQPFNAR